MFIMVAAGVEAAVGGLVGPRPALCAPGPAGSPRRAGTLGPCPGAAAVLCPLRWA